MQLLNGSNGRLDNRDLEAFYSLPFVACVPECAQEKAVEGLKKRRYVRGDFIYRQDDPPGSLFIVVDGMVRMERAFDNGRQHTIGWVSRGSFFGSHSIFGVVSRTENAIAVSNCELLLFDGHDLRDYLHQNPSAMAALFELVLDKWRGCLDRFSETVLLDVRERTIRVLVRMASQTQSTNETVLLDHVTQNELASWVGASRESVNRTLHSLAKMGLLRLESGKIRVTDLPRLVELDPANE